jgi:UDP-N-acetylmuramoyl-tripeptide--D-alanyl-D-alanine ligase
MRGARGISFTLEAGRERGNVRLNYLGQHNISNALGAAALALGAGVTLPAIRRGLSKAKPFSMRMQIEDWRGIGILNDAYNANPASMQAALRTLAEVGGRGQRIALLGDMFELGRHSERQHRALGKAVADAAIDSLYLLGEQADAVRGGALKGGMRPEQIIIGKDHADLANHLGERVKRGDWLLLKGSRGMKMERVLEMLKRGKA